MVLQLLYTGFDSPRLHQNENPVAVIATGFSLTAAMDTSGITSHSTVVRWCPFGALSRPFLHTNYTRDEVLLD